VVRRRSTASEGSLQTPGVKNAATSRLPPFGAAVQQVRALPATGPTAVGIDHPYGHHFLRSILRPRQAEAVPALTGV
jgi:hypothetical protein